MAIVHFVNYKRGTQSRAAMRGVTLYVMQEKKTTWEGAPLVSGINCQPQSVYDDFLNTKLLYHADRQTDLLESVSRQMSQLPTRTQLDDLLKTVRHLEQMTEQDGKPKENSFSLHRIRLPRLHLPHVSIPALISLLMAAAALLLLWWGLGTAWNSFGLLSL